MQNKQSLKWDQHFLKLCLVHSEMSKDPSTQVGAVIVGPDREVVGVGFNGFPKGIEDTPERLNDRDLKLQLIVHAEMNALMSAAKLGNSVEGCTMYMAANTLEFGVWGGPPCCRCMAHILQSGIDEIVSYSNNLPDKWQDSLKLSGELMAERGILYREL